MRSAIICSIIDRCGGVNAGDDDAPLDDARDVLLDDDASASSIACARVERVERVVVQPVVFFIIIILVIFFVIFSSRSFRDAPSRMHRVDARGVDVDGIITHRVIVAVCRRGVDARRGIEASKCIDVIVSTECMRA